MAGEARKNHSPWGALLPPVVLWLSPERRDDDEADSIFENSYAADRIMQRHLLSLLLVAGCATTWPVYESRTTHQRVCSPWEEDENSEIQSQDFVGCQGITERTADFKERCCEVVSVTRYVPVKSTFGKTP